MMTCENCGKAIPDNSVVCPNCGAATSASRPMPQQPSYNPPQQEQPSYMPPPQQGYMPQQPSYTPPQQGYMPPQQNYGYAQQQYAPPQQGINVTVVNNAGASKNNTPLIVEILLNVFLGIYGVGWLVAGETTTGIVLLVCSILLWWPILAAIFVFTLGLGFFCDVPIWITAIIVNAILLNNVLKRKATQQITVVQTR